MLMEDDTVTLDNNDSIFVNEDNTRFVLESTSDPINATSDGELLLETSNSTVSDTMFLEVQNTTSTGTVHEYYTNPSNNKILILHTTGSNNFVLTSNANGATSETTANITSFSKHLIIGVDTNFEDDLTINDKITLLGGSEQMQVLSIINSTAIICNTTIGDGSTVQFDNDVSHSMLLEPTVRGTTSANGLSTGNTTITGDSTFFTEDLLVNDVIYLSSNTTLKAQVMSIIDNTTLTVNTVLGDGSSNVNIIMNNLRNMKLEPSELTVTLSNKYDGTNNFFGIVEDSTTGFLHLEDGIGTLNVLYTTSNTNSGKVQFEEITTFSNVEPKLIVSS
tara:strand:- start:523 stop:1524 length:1002 start_codon:yes stop_codon:yes gene_type:complete